MIFQGPVCGEDARTEEAQPKRSRAAEVATRRAPDVRRRGTARRPKAKRLCGIAVYNTGTLRFPQTGLILVLILQSDLCGGGVFPQGVN